MPPAKLTWSPTVTWSSPASAIRAASAASRGPWASKSSWRRTTPMRSSGIRADHRAPDQPAVAHALVGAERVAQRDGLDVDVEHAGLRERDDLDELGQRAPAWRDDRDLGTEGREAHRDR